MGIYGAPKITHLLREEGLSISVKTVSNYMRFLGIQSIVKAKFPKRINHMSMKEKSLIKNLIQHLSITHPNQVWTTDITYIKTKNDGWVYLSSIIDLYSRKVISWDVSKKMNTSFVMTTLARAFKIRKPSPGLIVHSDKGAQYRSHTYRNFLLKHHCQFSYTRLNHSCDDNAHQESFHSLLKKEFLSHKTLLNIDNVKREVFSYIEGFYNTKRIHSSIGYVSPNSFERQYFLLPSPSRSCPIS